MKNDNLTIIIVLCVLLLAGLAIYRITQKQPKGYRGQSSENGKGLGWWEGLWNNAANIVDAGGRHTSSFVTSLGNTVSQIVATSKSGKYVYQKYGYSDPETDYGSYLLGGAIVIAAGVVAAIVLSRK